MIKIPPILLRKQTGRYWTRSRQSKTFLEAAGSFLGFKTIEDWYKLSAENLKSVGGSKILEKFGNSPLKLLHFLYPQHKWLFWQLSDVPFEMWNKMENQREFMEFLASQKGFRVMSDWYAVTPDDITKMGGYPLIVRYHWSCFKLLASIYPYHNWKPWLFKETTLICWENKEIQKEFLDQLGVQLGFKSMDDWYQVDLQHVQEMGGRTLLLSQKGCLSKLLMSVYPQHSWSIWRFKSNRLWDISGHQNREMIEWLGQELKIHVLDEWYRVSWDQLHQKVPPSFIKKYPLEQLLQEAYPHHRWNESKLKHKLQV